MAAMIPPIARDRRQGCRRAALLDTLSAGHPANLRNANLMKCGTPTIWKIQLQPPTHFVTEDAHYQRILH